MTHVPELEDHRPPAHAPSGDALPSGTRLRDYEITAVIGEGACSIVYLAWDHSLQRKVAVKEYLPASMAARIADSAEIAVRTERQLEVFKAGLKSFVNEARLLARFDHPSLCKVYRFWEDNGSAYMVMPYYEGPTLKTALAGLGHVPSEDELRAWLRPVLNAVTVLHEGGVWHQNIAPDEIVLTPVGPVLLGFAAAAHAIAAARHTPAAALKQGFAAIEQYGSEAATTRGPWTDLYALAAMVYAAITGSDPEAAADRLSDDRLRPLAVVAAGLYSTAFLAAIDAAMAVQPGQRPADHAEFRSLMGDIEAPQVVSLAPHRDLMQEPFIGVAAGDGEITVPDRPLLGGTAPAAAAPPAAEAKPRLALRPPAAVTAAPDDGQGTTPSWMAAERAQNLRKRLLFGAVAAAFACIGIAALVLQYAARPSGRVPLASAASTPARQARSAVPAASSPASAPVVATAPVLAPPSAMPAASVATSVPTAAGSAPASAIAPAATAVAAPPVAAASSLAVVAAAPAAAPAAAASLPPASPPLAGRPPPAALAASTPLAVAIAPAERQARCIEILQKASLEKIAAAETAFFKRECK